MSGENAKSVLLHPYDVVTDAHGGWDPDCARQDRPRERGKRARGSTFHHAPDEGSRVLSSAVGWSARRSRTHELLRCLFFAGDAPLDPLDVAARYGRRLSSSLEDWTENRADEDNIWLISWRLRKKVVALRPGRPRVDPRPGLLLSWVEKRLLEPQTISGWVSSVQQATEKVSRQTLLK